MGNLKKAVFAGGCFWCMESDFAKCSRIEKVVSGYMGGHIKKPTYEQVCSGTSGHLEVVEITYNESIISYRELLDIFFRHVDPTDAGGQFVDRGSQYRPAIFYLLESEKKEAIDMIKLIDEKHIFNNPIAVELIEMSEFYPAEEYHQGFYDKASTRYKNYRNQSGRDQFLFKVWSEEDEKVEMKEVNPLENLTQIQLEVTQNKGTEPPFNNEYWDLFEDGIYVDIISGEPLFSSKDKFMSSCGWPSFTKPIKESRIIKVEDISAGMIRIEVRGATSNAHLGHVFSDGPEPLGTRYCINSASLRFIPNGKLEEEGYGELYIN